MLSRFSGVNKLKVLGRSSAINKCLGTRRSPPSFRPWREAIESPTKLLLLLRPLNSSMTTPMVAPKPLMLKEYLELDHDDDDGLELGGGVATIRGLLDAELRKETAGRSDAVQHKATATANGNPLGKFSAVIEAVKRRAAFSVLSWKRKKQRPSAEQKSATVEDATWANPVWWQSLRFSSSPLASSRTSNSSGGAASPALAYDPATAAAGEAKKEFSPSENEEEEEATTTATPSPATVSNEIHITLLTKLHIAP